MMPDPAPTTESHDDGVVRFPIGLLVGLGAAIGSYAIGFIFWPELSAPGLSSPSRVLWCISSCTVVAAFCLWAVVRRWRDGRKRWAILLAAIFAVLCPQCLGIGRTVATRLQCGAWELKQETILRGVYQECLSFLDKGEPLPASVFLPMIEYTGPAAFINRCGPCGLAQVSIGTITMLDLAEGRATIDDLRREAERVNTGQSWEVYGNYVMCRDLRAFAGMDSKLLLGFVYPRHHPGAAMHDQANVNVIWADGHLEGTERLADPLVRERLRAGIEALTALGVPPPPKLPELLDQFDRSHP